MRLAVKGFCAIQRGDMHIPRQGDGWRRSYVGYEGMILGKGGVGNLREVLR